MSPFPTPFADINAVLDELLAEARRILGAEFVGMYLDGSLVLGDFNHDTSDIDMLVVTRDDLAPGTVDALQELHTRLARGESKWGDELEGAYIPLAALRRYDSANSTHP